jgi:hypothetical protein
MRSPMRLGKAKTAPEFNAEVIDDICAHEGRAGRHVR